MREIKFRAWDDINKKMIPPMSFESGVGCSVPNKYLNHAETDIFLGCKFNGMIFLQYTGTKDKTGAGFAGHDIIEISMIDKDGHNYTEKKIVYYHTETAMYRVGDNVGDYANSMPLHDIAFCSKVIGNIHENPELLEGNDE